VCSGDWIEIKILLEKCTMTADDWDGMHEIGCESFASILRFAELKNLHFGILEAPVLGRLLRLHTVLLKINKFYDFLI
jgi:hypothetical protein